MLSDADLAGMRATQRDAMPETCTVTRPPVGDIATTVPCRVAKGQRELYPFAALPNQPVQRFALALPALQDIQPNDLLTLEGDGRVYVVLHTQDPTSYTVSTTAVCVLAQGAAGGALGDAYLRPNATVTLSRVTDGTGSLQTDTGRRVHLAYGQANPTSPLDRPQSSGAQNAGGIMLTAVLFDLAGSDWQTGDTLQIESQDGDILTPAPDTFTLQGVVRRPLPFPILEADLLADVLLLNATISWSRVDGTLVESSRRVMVSFPPAYEQGGPASGKPLIIPLNLFDLPDVLYQYGDRLEITAMDSYTVIPAAQRWFIVQFITNVGKPHTQTKVNAVGFSSPV